MATDHMPADGALDVITALRRHGVHACVGGGWAVDALLAQQTRSHADLDLWIAAPSTEAAFRAFTSTGIDRIHPWPGDRPWNFVLHDAGTRHVDLHFYEALGDGTLRYGSIHEPFDFAEADLEARGSIAGTGVTCESPQFALRCRTGYEPREIDRHDVAALCTRFRLRAPDHYRG